MWQLPLPRTQAGGYGSLLSQGRHLDASPWQLCAPAALPGPRRLYPGKRPRYVARNEEYREDGMLRVTGAVVLAGLTFAAQAFAADAPAEIKIGTLYASSGRYPSISMPVYS